MKLVYDKFKMKNLPYNLLIQKDGALKNLTKEEFKFQVG